MLWGCSTVPILRVSQPWVRTLKSNNIIDPASNVKIDVVGTTSSLIGDEQLLSDKLSIHLSNLVKRRGFMINNSTYNYVFKLSYKSDRADKMRFSSTVSSSNTQAVAISTGSGAGATSGLGVSIARAIGALASNSTTVGVQTTEQSVSYTHTISIEILTREGINLWKGESTWDSNELNLISGIIPALQLILSDLPSNKNIRQEIPEVKESHVENYYRLECKDVWFTCPALPYVIMFSDNTPGYSNSVNIPSGVKNRNAFPAYVDLLQTAEFALPDGDEKDWKDPLEISLWKNVTLGGQYFLGPDKKQVNIIIELTGRTDGYYIKECKIVDDKEFSDFNTYINKWQQTLINYYDVYVK